MFIYNYVYSMDWVGGKGSALAIGDGEVLFVLDNKVWHFAPNGDVVIYNISKEAITNETWGIVLQERSASGLTGRAIVGTRVPAEYLLVARLDVSWRDRIIRASYEPEKIVIYDRRAGWAKVVSPKKGSFRYMNEHGILYGLLLVGDYPCIRVVPKEDKIKAVELFNNLWVAP